uniref:Uncharacterized protein n=1 Tax=Arion vulgaris TaxID=1028688 RepID=A0A0B7BRW2_9EUPU
MNKYYLEFGSTAWATAANTHLQTLDRVQNQALRIITGAMKSTPITEMQKTMEYKPWLTEGKPKI